MKTPSFELAVHSASSEDAERLALVLPGRLDTKDYPHMLSHTECLAHLGYLAITFDPPGTWESPGDIGLYTMTNYLQAINELIEMHDNRPTVLFGHSRGGSMAMLAGATNPHVTHFVAAMSRSAASIPEDEQGAHEVSYRDDPAQPGEQRRFDLPRSYFEDAAQYDMTEHLKSCAKPKLFFLGTHDALVTPDSVRTMYEQAAEPKQLCELDSDHDYRRHPAVIKEVNHVLSTFLKA